MDEVKETISLSLVIHRENCDGGDEKVQFNRTVEVYEETTEETIGWMLRRALSQLVGDTDQLYVASVVGSDCETLTDAAKEFEAACGKYYNHVNKHRKSLE